MQLLDTIYNPFGGRVWYRETTASTMADAEELISRGETDGSLVAAGYQTAGQGRFTTRRWEAQAGQSLLFTLIIPRALAVPATPGFPPSLLLAAGLCLWLEGLGIKPAIKWPNDILVDERKLAGILVTGTRGRYTAGIGINFGQAGFDPSGFRRPAGSLLMQGIELKPLEALAPVLAGLHSAFGLADPRAAVQSRLWRLHGEHELQTSPDSPSVRGRIAGIDADGALLLDTPDGRRRFVSGE